MKLPFQILLILTMTTSSCAEDSLDADDCSVSVNRVIFSKSLNKGENMIKEAKENSVSIKSGARSDFFNAANGKEKYSNAPMLLTPINNKEPFTFTAKVTPEFSATYDAGALYMFVDNDLWQKFAFEMDERKMTRLVTVRTDETSDDNNHDVVTVKSVFMKISSDIESIGYYYSTDSIDWQLVRLYKNSYPTKLWLGISAQSPIGPGITALFENCTLIKTPIEDFRKGI